MALPPYRVDYSPIIDRPPYQVAQRRPRRPLGSSQR